MLKATNKKNFSWKLFVEPTNPCALIGVVYPDVQMNVNNAVLTECKTNNGNGFIWTWLFKNDSFAENQLELSRSGKKNLLDVHSVSDK